MGTSASRRLGSRRFLSDRRIWGFIGGCLINAWLPIDRSLEQSIPFGDTCQHFPTILDSSPKLHWLLQYLPIDDLPDLVDASESNDRFSGEDQAGYLFVENHLSFCEQPRRQRSILVVDLCFEEQRPGGWIDDGTDARDLDLSWLVPQIEIEVNALSDG